MQTTNLATTSLHTEIDVNVQLRFHALRRTKGLTLVISLNWHLE